MNNTIQANTMDTRTRNNQVIFYKSQEEFVQALREAGSLEEIGSAEDLLEEE
ncbi:hypothetical protein ACTL32_01215 [Planococcus sp. FY231025]|uniref:hypothetical protein n=1 Tax=Planococcus sp. FY231025 TaxID=3455699 RepID=UPI003F9387E2